MGHQQKLWKSLVVALSAFSCAAPEPAGDQQFPILILGTDRSFGSYTAEILKTEGFNEFQLDSVAGARVSLTYLKSFDLVILGERSLTRAQQKLLRGYVKEGGNLIAFKPDRELHDVFGIVEAGDSLEGGYLSIQADSEIGKGIIPDRLQFHGAADLVNLKGGKKIASLAVDEFPAVVMNDYDRGHAIAFLYNLPQSIVYTRQGNYRNAGKEMDGITGIRAMDLFTDGWVDTSRNCLNQADEQMRLLSHCIEKMTSYTKPLPRFWYFPDSLKCLVTLTNDGEDSKEIEFGPQFSDVNAKGAKMVLYIKETDRVSKEWVSEWINKGFEIGGHFDDTQQAQNPDWKTMDSVIKELKNRLKTKYDIAGTPTVVNHWFVWCGKDIHGITDFTAQAKLEASNGIGMDINYAHYDNNSSQGHFLGALGSGQGNFTGSGLAMKFADNGGKVLDIYQHLNNVYDQQYMEHKDQAGFFNCFRGLMDRSLTGEVYSCISVKAHNNEYFFSKVPLSQMLEYANAHGIPVWAPVKLLEFLKAKDEARFTHMMWANDQLSFTLESALTHPNGITCLIPYSYKGKEVREISGNAITQPFAVRSIKGFQYAMVTLKPGTSYKIGVRYKGT